MPGQCQRPTGPVPPIAGTGEPPPAAEPRRIRPGLPLPEPSPPPWLHCYIATRKPDDFYRGVPRREAPEAPEAPRDCREAALSTTAALACAGLVLIGAMLPDGPAGDDEIDF